MLRRLGIDVPGDRSPRRRAGPPSGLDGRVATATSEGCRMDFLWFILIGIAAGWLAGQVMKGGGYGLVGDLIVGVIGALLGGFLFGLLGVSAGGLSGAWSRRRSAPSS